MSPFRRFSVVAVLACAASCDSTPSGEPGASSSETVGSAADPGASPSNPAPDDAAPKSPLAGSWSGAFAAKAGDVSVPDGVSYDAWKEDPGGATGNGKLEITVADDGTVNGKISGALGDLDVAGLVEGTDLSAGVTPRDPDAQPAMRGVLTGSLDGEKLKIELRVSSGDATVVREATFELTR